MVAVHGPSAGYFAISLFHYFTIRGGSRVWLLGRGHHGHGLTRLPVPALSDIPRRTGEIRHHVSLVFAFGEILPSKSGRIAPAQNYSEPDVAVIGRPKHGILALHIRQMRGIGDWGLCLLRRSWSVLVGPSLELCCCSKKRHK